MRRYFPLLIDLVLLLGALAASIRFVYPDFMQEYGAAWARLHGLDPNQPLDQIFRLCCRNDFANVDTPFESYRIGHPPFSAMLALPLALLSWPVARLVWLALGVVAIIAGWRIAALPLVARIATIPWWMDALGLGTVEPVLFGLLAGAIALGDRMPRQAGVLLGFAAALKIYPALLIAGAWLAGRRSLAATATLSFGLAMLAGELALGWGMTRAWMAYVPINTLRFIDIFYNLSLPHYLRLLVPGLAPTIAVCAAIVMLGAPLLPRVVRRHDWAALLPVMLLATPLCWGQYLPLVTLQNVKLGILALLGITGLLDILAIFKLFNLPAGSLFLLGNIVLPLLILILAWGDLFFSRSRPGATLASDTP